MAHGAKAVYFKGLDALGYPPTWVDKLGEAIRVNKAVETIRSAL